MIHIEQTEGTERAEDFTTEVAELAEKNIFFSAISADSVVNPTVLSVSSAISYR
jgi:hypothetical protein